MVQYFQRWALLPDSRYKYWNRVREEMGNCHKELENRLNEKGETRWYKVEWKRTNWGGEFEIEGGGGGGEEEEEEEEKGGGGDERTKKQFAYTYLSILWTQCFPSKCILSSHKLTYSSLTPSYQLKLLTLTSCQSQHCSIFLMESFSLREVDSNGKINEQS